MNYLNKKMLNYLLRLSNGNFIKHPKKDYLNTPSYNQVSQPLFTKSIGRWKNYQDEFDKILDKWIQKWLLIN